MNQSLIQLEKISQKKSRLILGLMSGTSADGLDISVTSVSGSGRQTKTELIWFGTASYSTSLQHQLKMLLFDEDAAQGKILALQRDLEEEWIFLIKQLLENWMLPISEIDLVASHGQTVLHLPSSTEKRAATWQLIDGDFLASKLGILTVSDFRKKHIAVGFDGAPLAPLAERLLVDQNNIPSILLNLGGIANFTVLDISFGRNTVPFSTDAGPANTLIDAAVRHYFKDKSYDESGKIAASGNVNGELLDQLKKHRFYKKKVPKSTGPEEFTLEWVLNASKQTAPDLSPEDLIATLTKYSAWGVGREIREKIGSEAFSVYVSGGGVYNDTLINMIKKELPDCEVQSSEAIGIDPDGKEAILFSVFANELVAGNGWELESGETFTLGKLSFPS